MMIMPKKLKTLKNYKIIIIISRKQLNKLIIWKFYKKQKALKKKMNQIQIFKLSFSNHPQNSGL